jgi:hypothetical protein
MLCAHPTGSPFRSGDATFISRTNRSSDFWAVSYFMRVVLAELTIAHYQQSLVIASSNPSPALLPLPSPVNL